ncbi:MAG: hypothetical protein ABEJ88_01275 [Halobacterium sp.]
MRRAALPAICIAALLVTAGCTGLPVVGASGDHSGRPASDPEARRLAADAREAMRAVESYRMNATLHVSLEGDAYHLERRGVFDAEAKRARLTLAADGTRRRAYVDGTTMYVNTSDGWTTREFAGDANWSTAVGVAQQRRLLRNGTVTFLGNETVDGVRTTVLRVYPEEGVLRQLVTREAAGTGLGPITIEEATYRLYLAKDTHLPVKVEMNLQLTVEASPDRSGHGSATITFTDYGTPVNVTIPDRATGSE